MDPLTDISTAIALSMGLAWASGINLYATILALSIMSLTGNIDLPPNLQIVESPMVMAAAGFMFCLEFFADKTPGVDTGWDAIQTFIRIPAGAVLAAAALGDVNPGIQLAAGIIGGGVSAATHTAKAGTRVLINTSPEPVTNWTASFAEDFAVILGVWTALHHPILFLVLFVLFILLLIWLLPKIWRGVKFVGSKLSKLFTKLPADLPPEEELVVSETEEIEEVDR